MEGVREMLNRKQLEDAAECKGKCFQCHRKYCQEQIAQTALKLADMLKRLEWLVCSYGIPGQDEHCPICREYKGDGHTKGCELAALLKGLEAEK
jgi:hypothetical protein